MKARKKGRKERWSAADQIIVKFGGGGGKEAATKGALPPCGDRPIIGVWECENKGGEKGWGAWWGGPTKRVLGGDVLQWSCSYPKKNPPSGGGQTEGGHQKKDGP